MGSYGGYTPLYTWGYDRSLNFYSDLFIHSPTIDAQYAKLSSDGYAGVHLSSQNGYFRFDKIGGEATPYISIIDGGNVGIGTTSPQTKLDVNGSIWANISSGVTVIAAITGANASSSNGGLIALKTLDQEWRIETGYSVGNRDFAILDATSSIDRFHIQQSTGNVGIGTTEPHSGYKLDVRGNVIIGTQWANSTLTIAGQSGFGGVLSTQGETFCIDNSRAGDMIFWSKLYLASTGALTPGTFTSGSLGTGWKLDYNATVASKSYLEIDNIRVRDTLFASVFQKDIIRVSNGQFYFTDGGIIAAIDGTYVYFDPDKSATFSSGQRLEVKDIAIATGIGITSVKLDLTSGPTTVDGLARYTYTLVSGTIADIAVGSTAARISGGNLLADAVTANSPFLDVRHNYLTKARLGNLSGITSPTFGTLSGWGLWSDNIYLEGNANILGTLAVGGGNTIGNTFYVGKIQKNLIQGSENWSSNWYYNNATVSADYSVAPDGTTTADRLLLRNISWDLYRNISVVAGVVYTVSFFVKSVNVNNFCVVINNTVAWNTVGGKCFTEASGEISTTEWKRISYTFTAPATNQINIHLGGHSESITQQDPGSLDIWGAQLEVGSTATPYQKTDATLSSSTGYGMWATAGGFGGTMQNPVVALGDYGMNVLGAGTAAALSNNSIMIGNITGSANSAIKLTNTGTQGTSGLFGYTSAGAESFALRLDGTAAIAGWNFNATDLSSGGIHLVSSATAANNKIYIGTGTYGNANTAFFVGGDGKFSLKDKLTWDGTTLTVNGGGIFTGDVSIGSGNAIFKADSNGIYLGNATFASAPFSVDPAGALKATNANIGSWLVDSNSISKVLFTTIGRADNVIMRWSSVTEGTSQASWTYGSNKLQGFGIYFNNGGPAIALHLGVMTTASGVKLDGTGNPYVGISMFDQSAREYFALGAGTTSGDVYNRIAGWAFDSAKLYSSNLSGTSDGTDYTTAGMVLGSTGYIAALKFLLKADGSALFKGTLSAPDGDIGGFTISATEGLYAGTGATRVQMKAGAGFWAGATARADAPFSVTEAGALKAVSGIVGPWTISSTSLSTGAFDTVDKLYFGTSGLSLSNTFKVTAAGALTATGATITGTLTATSGYIGDSTNGWTIGASGITAKGSSIIQTSASANTGIKLDATSFRLYNGSAQTGELAVDGSGWFGLTGARAISWTTAGVVTIGGWTASASALSTGAFDTVDKMYFGSSGLSLSNVFKVTAAGALTAASGTVGGWAIAADSISIANKARLYATGILSLGSGDGYKTAYCLYLDGDNSKVSFGAKLYYESDTLTVASASFSSCSIANVTAGNNIIKYIPTGIANTGGSPSESYHVCYWGFDGGTGTRRVKYRLPCSGTVRVNFTLKTNDGSKTVYGRIYKNDAASGAEHSTTSTSGESFYDDISVSEGDLLELYIKQPSYGALWEGATNFWLSVAEVPGILKYLSYE
jgi:hypothetical protein